MNQLWVLLTRKLVRTVCEYGALYREAAALIEVKS